MIQQSMLPTPIKTTPSKMLGKIINPGDWLLDWAWKLGAEGKPLQQAYGAGVGSSVHGALEDYSDGHPVVPAEHEVGARNAIEGLKSWLDDTEPRLHVVEHRLYGEVEGVRFAGRLDYARVTDTGYILGDVKTTKRLRDPGASAHLQVGLYALLWPDPSEVAGVEILNLGRESGGYGVHVGRATDDQVRVAIDHFRTLCELD